MQVAGMNPPKVPCMFQIAHAQFRPCTKLNRYTKLSTPPMQKDHQSPMRLRMYIEGLSGAHGVLRHCAVGPHLLAHFRVGI